MTWTAPKIDRAVPIEIGTERELLESTLDFHRQTLLMKCASLDEARLKIAAVESSTLSLLALVRHMAENEYWWFCEVVDGQNADDLPYYGRDDDPDADLNDAAQDDPVAVFERHQASIAAAKAAVAGHGLDHVAEHPRTGRSSVMWVYLHMIEEYARHNGHADLIREGIDGEVGE